jgi:tetratricopeptide (TPR) repeat protein/tRNA A-37 threonylcarbamoyl transferase component Bud32
MPDFYEEDKDIKLFKEGYPDFYEVVLRLIERKYDKVVKDFIEGYDGEFCKYVQKIVDGELDDEDVRRLKEEYPEEIYIAIQKIIEREAGRLSKEKPQIAPYKKGDFIGQKYEVYDVLGMGGFGIVYLVYSQETESVYALKTFRDEYLEDSHTRDRFRKEAQVWIDLERHPYIVRASFVDEISGRLFIATEYIAPDEQGLNTLEGYLRRSPPDLAQSLRWAIQFCYGMEYAYSKGIRAHRDIKPANIMIGQDKAVKISDFGLAGVISTSSLLSIKAGTRQNSGGEAYQTVAGTAFGTPPYMPPEQFENAAGCDERSDIYSFGIVLYQMASGGKLPFCPDMSEDRGNDIFQSWYMLHCKASVPRLKSPLFPVIFRCLEKKPINRYFSFKELRRDLESLLKKQTGEIVKLPELKELEAWELGNKGVSLSNLGKPQEAIACYNRALEINPTHADAWCNKGAALYDLGKPQEAIACYDRALEINPTHADAWLNKGAALYDLGKPQEAIACYGNALKINPTYALAWYNKGVVLGALGKYQEAIACYDKALEINPGDATAWVNKGVALGKLGKYQGEIACYDRSLEINPTFAEAWYNKGNALGKLDKVQGEIACYNKALEINPRHAKAWGSKGNSLDSLGKYQEAIACYDRALEINPTFAEAWYNKGNALVRLDKPQEAIACYDRALEIDPRDAKVWYNRGQALGNLGKYQEAIACYDKALEINPGDATAWCNKALAEDKLNRTQEAISLYKHFLRLASGLDADLIANVQKRLEELEGKYLN